jgi:hypothetical protein
MSLRHAFNLCLLGSTLCAQTVKPRQVAEPGRQEPRGVVDRYIEWRGGHAFEKLRTVHRKGVLEADGLTGTEEVWAELGGHVRVADNTLVLRQTQVVAPQNSWDTTPSGQIETLSVSDHHSLERLQALQFADALRGGQKTQVSMLGFAERQGRSWAVIRVSFGDEDTYDAFIDPQTGELLGYRIVEDRRPRFESLSGWQFVDGVRMSFVDATTTDSPGDDSIVRATAVSINEVFAPELFKRPVVARKAMFREGATSTGWIPFELLSGTRIYLPAKVDGHDVNVLLDSGATVSSIDKAYAASIGLASKGSFAGAGSGGMDTFGFISGVRIEVGNLTLQNINVGTFDFAPVAQNIGHPLPFVLGNEVFNELAVEIDFRRRRILFRDPDTVVKPANSVLVPLTRTKDRTVPVSVEGKPAVQFEFDLGNGSAVDVFPAYYKAQKLLEKRRTSQKLGGGVGGFAPQTIATLHAVTFAGVTFEQVPADFANDVQSANNSNLILGSVGVPLLMRFHLIIDYSHDRLFAAPDNEVEAPFVKDRLGFYGSGKDGAILVDFISPGSPAQTAAIRVGDRVTLIDQLPADHWTEAELRLLRNGPAGTRVTFTLAGGDVKRATLADFY